MKNLAEEIIMTKLYLNRDSATSILRKLGIPKEHYSQFITEVNGKYDLNLSAATRFLNAPPDAKPSTVKPPIAKIRTNTPPPKVRKAIVGTSISKFIRGMISDGKTNDEIWSVLSTDYGFDDSKKYYPGWYRCEMRRTGLLPKE